MDKTKKSITVLVISFLEYCEVEKGLSDKTQENYKLFLDKFINWLKSQKKSDLKPHELQKEHIWNYRLYLARQKSPKTGRLLQKSTQTHYLVALRNLLAYFAEKDMHSLAPEKIKLPREKDSRVKFLKLKQLEKLFLQPDTTTRPGLRDRAILESLFSTGLRVSEMVALDRQQITGAESHDVLEVPVTGKGGSNRTVYFSVRALTWLAKYLATRRDTDKALFINYKGPRNSPRRLSQRSVEQVVKKYARLAGLSVIATPHTIRHSYATDMLAQGVDLRIIQELLGHKNIATTQIYTHVVNQQLKDVHKKYHSGSKLKDV